MRNRLIAGLLFAFHGLASSTFVEPVSAESRASTENIDPAPFAHFEPTPWRRARERLEQSQSALVAGLKAFDGERLDDQVGDREYTFYFLLHGIIQHDIYHGGQIALLKKASAAMEA